MHIGITGSRDGCSPLQLAALKAALTILHTTTIFTLHHGCCVGVDEQAHLIAKALNVNIWAHPPTNKSLIMKAPMNNMYRIEDDLPYLHRNEIIVSHTELLIAVPRSMENKKSGTWYTIKLAQEYGSNIIILKPDGGIALLNGT